jgi:hypothetical protein
MHFLLLWKSTHLMMPCIGGDDAALGMNWLHHSTPTIIHRDLKVRSV